MIDTLTDEQLARTRASTHERVNDLIVAPRRRSRRIPGFALAVAVVVAAAVSFAPSGSPARPALATAATVLRELEPQPLPTLGAGEFYAVRVVQREAGNPTEALDSRYWTDADGEGRELVLFQGEVKRDDPIGAARTTESLLPAFPDDPARVRAYLRERAQTLRPKGEQASEPTTRDYVLAAAQMVFDFRGTPPETLRATFDFLSGLPGMRLIGDVTDPLGRPGTSVAADGDAKDHEGVGLELIVDPDTGRPLAFIHYRREGGVSKPWLQTIRTEGVVNDTHTLPR